jgi:hypothetical protein
MQYGPEPADMQLEHGMVCHNTPICMLNRIERRKRFNCANITRFAHSALRELSQLIIPSALQAFDMMHTAGCLPDQSSNAYCFIDAAHAINPSDLYFFQLPLGISLPNNTTPSCSSCTKSLMALYAQSLENAAKGTLAYLEKTYSSGQKVAVAQCGASYAQALTATSGAVGRETWIAAVSLPAILLTCVILSLVS